MSEAVRQVDELIRLSLDTYLVLFGPDKKPIHPGSPGFDAARNQVCHDLHSALDAVQGSFSRDEALAQSPDELARNIRGQLDELRVRYTMDRRSKLLSFYGYGGTPGKWKYKATLPLDKWATYVSGGLALTWSVNALTEWPAHCGTREAEEEPSPLAVRISPVDGLEYTWIPAGQFWMGALPGDMNARQQELPRTEVRLTRGFWISRGPVTVGAFRRYARQQRIPMPSPPSFNDSWWELDHPMVRVSWHDACAYCRWAGGRLPTEAEWEYAARGGRDGFYYPWGNEVSPDRANYSDSKVGGTSVVRTYEPNAFALYDLAGNVSEWCEDWFGGDYYAELSDQRIAENPSGPESGTVRVLRGGSWCYSSRYLRSSSRLWFEPEDHDYDIGFRCVLDAIP